MQKQIKAIVGVLIYPKRTMQELPSDKIYLLSVLAPFYFAVGRVFHPNRYDLLYNKLGGDIQIILFALLLTVIALPIAASLLQLFLRLFRKHLSIIKLLNIMGYSHVPRLLVAIIGYVIVFFNPSMFDENRLTPGILAILVLGITGMAYNTFLLIFGIVVSPSDDTTPTNSQQAIPETTSNEASQELEN